MAHPPGSGDLDAQVGILLKETFAARLLLACPQGKTRIVAALAARDNDREALEGHSMARTWKEMALWHSVRAEVGSPSPRIAQRTCGSWPLDDLTFHVNGSTIDSSRFWFATEGRWLQWLCGDASPKPPHPPQANLLWWHRASLSESDPPEAPVVPQVAEPKLTLPLVRTVSEETNFRAFPPKVCIAASIVMYAVTCKASSRGDTRYKIQPPLGG